MNNIEKLQQELKTMHLAYDILNEAYDIMNKTNQDTINRLEQENINLKYDQNNPWWKFW